MQYIKMLDEFKRRPRGGMKMYAIGKMDEFIALAERVKFFRNAYRCNVVEDVPENFRYDKNGQRWAKPGPMSVTIREGPLLAKAQEWFPDCNAVCLNRKRATSPPMARHKDGKNLERESHICIWGDYPEGEGALILEPDDGTVERITERKKWHSRAVSEIVHHVEPHSSGTRYSAICFKGKPVRMSTQFQKGGVRKRLQINERGESAGARGAPCENKAERAGACDKGLREPAHPDARDPAPAPQQREEAGVV